MVVVIGIFVGIVDWNVKCNWVNGSFYGIKWRNYVSFYEYVWGRCWFWRRIWEFIVE